VDKKAKKRIQVLNERLQNLRGQLAGARKQMDEPSEVAALEKQIAAAEAELDRLREQ
jgi:DNA-binding FrmR family transcriptional regulator